jgi:hypothetical protein
VTDPTPTLPKVQVDTRTFTGAEAMALQREFECDWTDLVAHVNGKVSQRTRGKTLDKLVDSSGRVRFADEVLRWMIWTVWLRDDPKASRAPLDPLQWDDLLALMLPLDQGKVGTPRRGKTTT